MTSNIPASETQQPPSDADIDQEFSEVGEEFGCHRLPGETTHAYGIRLLTYVGEMASEMKAVESRVADLLGLATSSQHR